MMMEVINAISMFAKQCSKITVHFSNLTNGHLVAFSKAQLTSPGWLLTSGIRWWHLTPRAAVYAPSHRPSERILRSAGASSFSSLAGHVLQPGCGMLKRQEWEMNGPVANRILLKKKTPKNTRMKRVEHHDDIYFYQMLLKSSLLPSFSSSEPHAMQ